MDRRTALKKTAAWAGTAAIAPSLFSILQSCQNEPRLNWQPAILSSDQARLISSLVDTILPKTETPGGLDMKVDLFIDKVVHALYDEESQKAVLAEMDAFNADCKATLGDNFSALSNEEKAQFLREKEKGSAKFNGAVWGTAVGKQEPVGFYRSIKSMMLWGYFTSQEIGKNVLSYDPIPGNYNGCIPLSDIGNTWSL
jgi:hypothetical protein